MVEEEEEEAGGIGRGEEAYLSDVGQLRKRKEGRRGHCGVRERRGRRKRRICGKQLGQRQCVEMVFDEVVLRKKVVASKSSKGCVVHEKQRYSVHEKQLGLGQFPFYMGEPDCFKRGRSAYRLMPGPKHTAHFIQIGAKCHSMVQTALWFFFLPSSSYVII